MGDTGTQRQLIGILSADVVSYTRLMAADEAATVAAMAQLRQEVSEIVGQYRGRIVDSVGDNFLAAFASIVDAVNCARALQETRNSNNQPLPQDRQIWLRIGVNLGDVIVDDARIYGDGVNVAARLEGLADPGGITISGAAYDQIRNKIDTPFSFRGDHHVKNVSDPVRVYALETSLSAPPIDRKTPSQWPAFGLAIVIAALCFAGVWTTLNPTSTQLRAVVEEVPLVPATKPSIIVMPFEAQGDAAELFALGITDDLITDLSKNNRLIVADHRATAQFQNTDVSLSEVAKALNVQFVLTGTVRQVDQRVRVNARLVDANTGAQTWADRYDVTLTQLFAKQDSVTSRIIQALPFGKPVRQKPILAGYETENLAAQEAFDEGWMHFRKGGIRDFATAIPYFEKATEIDPAYAKAHGALSTLYQMSFARYFPEAPVWYQLSLDEMSDVLIGRMDLANNVPNPLLHTTRALFRMARGRHNDAIIELEKALALDQTEPIIYETLALTLIFSGDIDRAILTIERARELEPGENGMQSYVQGYAHFMAQHYERAEKHLKDAIQHNATDLSAYVALIATLGHLGKQDEAKERLETLNRLRLARTALTPPPTLEDKGFRVIKEFGQPLILTHTDGIPFHRKTDRENLRTGLMAAGVPLAQPEAEEIALEAGVTRIGTAAVEKLRSEGAVVIDLRSFSSWIVGYIPGSIRLEMGSEWGEAALLSVAARDRDIIFQCGTFACADARKAIRDAVSWGYENVYFYEGGFLEWRASGKPVAFDAGTTESNAQVSPYDGFTSDE